MAPGAPPHYLSAQRQRSQLPAEVTGFIGRKAELARIVALLDTARLVTVTGPGGVGKTRVALRSAAQVAASYRDGVCLVELSGLQDPGLLAGAVADCLGLPESGPHPPGEALLGYLRERQMLLILDTCEHLIDACAAFVEGVLREAPGVTLLATSSQPLDVLGEHTCLIPPLPVPAVPGADARGGGREGERAVAWGVSTTAPASQATGGGDAVELFAERACASDWTASRWPSSSPPSGCGHCRFPS
jgi:predicted ATPase